MTNFISEKLCNLLKLNKFKNISQVRGIGACESTINYAPEIQLSFLDESYNVNLICKVLPEITSKLPVVTFNPQMISIPK